MVAASLTWLFKVKCIQTGNSVPQLHEPRFKCSVATCDHYLTSDITVESSIGQSWSRWYIFKLIIIEDRRSLMHL